MAKDKKQIALNKLFVFYIVSGIIFLCIALVLITSKDTGWAIFFGFFGLLFLIVPIIMIPYCYKFDSEGVSICYLFLPVERYLWNKIYDIHITMERYSFYLDIFSITGKVEGESRSYMDGHIYRSRKTKRLLEEHWDGTITGYCFEDAKKWYQKRKSKKEAYIKAHFTDEIVPMEREIRAKVRQLMADYTEEVQKHNLVIRTQYFYVTKSSEELKSRPKEGYVYTACTEISELYEKDENRIVCADTDLLYVRYGKTGYKGSVNDNAMKELRSALTDLLEEINKNGFDFYCSKMID